MTGGGDEMAVTGMNIKVIKAWVTGEGIVERRAAPAVFRGVEKLKKRLEELCTNDGLAMS